MHIGMFFWKEFNSFLDEKSLGLANWQDSKARKLDWLGVKADMLDLAKSDHFLNLEAQIMAEDYVL